MNLSLIISLFVLFASIFSFHSGTKGQFSSTHVNKSQIVVRLKPTNTPTPTIVPSPTPIPNIECMIGSSVLSMPQASCDKATQEILSYREQDMATVQSKIDTLKQQEQPYLDKFNSIDFQSCSGVGFVGGNPSINTYAMQSCINGLITMANLYRAMINNYNSKIQWLMTYKNGIDNLFAGAGACSDHGGVDCAANRGDIGQVICNDGWNQSSVYYFNVDECVKYYVSANTSR